MSSTKPRTRRSSCRRLARLPAMRGRDRSRAPGPDLQKLRSSAPEPQPTSNMPQRRRTFGADPVADRRARAGRRTSATTAPARSRRRRWFEPRQRRSRIRERRPRSRGTTSWPAVAARSRPSLSIDRPWVRPCEAGSLAGTNRTAGLRHGCGRGGGATGECRTSTVNSYRP